MNAAGADATGEVVALYGQALFKKDDPETNEEQLRALRGSGFDTVILFALHVHPDGELFYSDVPIAQNGVISPQANPHLPQLVAALRQGGAQTVLFSIGAGGVADYQNIQALLQTKGGQAALEKNFQAVASWLKIDGFDLDDEEDGISPKTIATLATLLHPLSKKGILTAAPYTEMDFWLACLEEVFKQSGEQLFRWWNLQVYGGADAEGWITSLAGFIKSHDVGLTDANAFIVPGYSVAGSTPGEICAALSDLEVGGGFLWNAGSIFASGSPPKVWAKAIVDGLSGRCP